MTSTPKIFFCFLAGFALLAVILGYEGIDRLRRTHSPPFHDGSVMAADYGAPLSQGAVRALHSAPGRLGVWLLVLGVPLSCGWLAFKQERLVLGLGLLLLWAALCGWVGWRLYFHGAFDAIP